MPRNPGFFAKFPCPICADAPLKAPPFWQNPGVDVLMANKTHHTFKMQLVLMTTIRLVLLI